MNWSLKFLTEDTEITNNSDILNFTSRSQINFMNNGWWICYGTLYNAHTRNHNYHKKIKSEINRLAHLASNNVLLLKRLGGIFMHPPFYVSQNPYTCKIRNLPGKLIDWLIVIELKTYSPANYAMFQFKIRNICSGTSVNVLFGMVWK